MGWYFEGGAGKANELQELDSCLGERVTGGGRRGTKVPSLALTRAKRGSFPALFAGFQAAGLSKSSGFDPRGSLLGVWAGAALDTVLSA